MKTEVIASTQNPRIKSLVKLRDRHGGGTPDEILIDGRREIVRAMEAGVAVQEIFFCRSRLRNDDERTILQPAAARGTRMFEVSESVMEKLVYGQRTDSIVATAPRPRIGLADLHLGDCPLVGVVECVEKPGNLGAILRTADGAGVDALLVVSSATDVYGANVIRSSVGAVFRVPMVETSATEAIAWLLAHRLRLVAADPAGKKLYTDVDYCSPTAMVFGSEADGLTSAWKRLDVLLAKVPMLGLADSLNVSITAALFFYEALRQRTRSGSNKRLK